MCMCWGQNLFISFTFHVMLLITECYFFALHNREKFWRLHAVKLNWPCACCAATLTSNLILWLLLQRWWRPWRLWQAWMWSWQLRSATYYPLPTRMWSVPAEPAGASYPPLNRRKRTREAKRSLRWSGTTELQWVLFIALMWAVFLANGKIHTCNSNGYIAIWNKGVDEKMSPSRLYVFSIVFHSCG